MANKGLFAPIESQEYPCLWVDSGGQWIVCARSQDDINKLLSIGSISIMSGDSALEEIVAEQTTALPVLTRYRANGESNGKDCIFVLPCPWRQLFSHETVSLATRGRGTIHQNVIDLIRKVGRIGPVAHFDPTDGGQWIVEEDIDGRI